MSYDDLVRIIKNVETFAVSANGKPIGEVTLDLQNGPEREQFSGPVSQLNLKDAMALAHGVQYEMSCPSCVAISRVDIELADGRRRIEVVGNSKPHVRAIEATLAEDFSGYETLLNATIIQFTVMAAYTFGFGLIAYRWRRHKWSPFAIIPLSLVGVIPLLPFKSWFPPVSLFQGEASPLVRYAAEISFAGVLISILTFSISMLYSYIQTRRSSASGSA